MSKSDGHDSRLSRLKGTMIDELRKKGKETERCKDIAEFEARFLNPGQTFSSADNAYEIVRVDKEKRVVHAKFGKKEGGTKVATRNFGVDELWRYYEEKRLDF